MSIIKARWTNVAAICLLSFGFIISFWFLAFSTVSFIFRGRNWIFLISRGRWEIVMGILGGLGERGGGIFEGNFIIYEKGVLGFLCKCRRFRDIGVLGLWWIWRIWISRLNLGLMARFCDFFGLKVAEKFEFWLWGNFLMAGNFWIWKLVRNVEFWNLRDFFNLKIGENCRILKLAGTFKFFNLKIGRNIWI